ncbi:MAG: hypothetical protein CMO63_03705, partial [Verrucomicrobiales bacterium]|nr:hypothetical protein [Verrucomicrobiales bacterium]
MRENTPCGKSPKNELAGGCGFSESPFVTVIRELILSCRGLTGALLLLVGGSGVVAEEAVLGHWLLAPERVQAKRVHAVTGPDAVIEGLGRSVIFTDDPAPGHVQLSGKNSRIEVTSDISTVEMPQRALTLEAWVRIDKALEWGGIIGALQDNGAYEKGWLLGFRGSNFCFALNTERSNKLTYLTAPAAFESGRWYHVAGTYDGTTQRLFVDGKQVAQATEQGGAIVYPPKTWLEIGAYHDDNELYMMAGRLHEVRMLGQALAAEAIIKRHGAKRSLFPEPEKPVEPLAIAYGPFVDWVDRSTATITWEVDQPMQGKLRWSMPSGESAVLKTDRLAKRHTVTVTKLLREGEYTYQILSEDPKLKSKTYKFDSSFYYRLPRVTLGQAENSDAGRVRNAVKQMLDLANGRAGYCLVLGGVDGSLALELVRQSDFQVLVLDDRPEVIRNVRSNLDAAGVYGVRATAKLGKLDERVFGPMLFNLIVSERHLLGGELPVDSAADAFRSLAPAGGTLVLGQSGNFAPVQEWFGKVDARTIRDGNNKPVWQVSQRPALAGAGDWTHQYGNAQNTSCSDDELVKGEMGVKWWGEPGPRPMPDRGPRNPAPLSAGGRLYIQGDRMLFGLDAYNGSVLWSQSSPEMRRANIPRDSSNMVADERALYVAQGRYCIHYDGQTGQRARRFAVPEADTGEHHWSFLAVEGSTLVGSRVNKGTLYLGDDGEWFEDFKPSDISRVTSDRLFGVDTAGGDIRWEYSGGAIINSTITIGEDVIYFIESTAEAARAKAGTIQTIDQLTHQKLVALDLKSGQRQWERDHDFSKLQFMTYLVYADDMLIATGTDKDKNYHTYALSASRRVTDEGGDAPTFLPPGSLLWEDHHKEGKGHHSGHLQHPVIVGDTFYSDQWAFDLNTGKQIRDDLPERRGCGTMSASRHSMFFRHYFHGMWNLDTNKRTQFEGIRSGCWLGLIPAGGMLLAPE